MALVVFGMIGLAIAGLRPSGQDREPIGIIVIGGDAGTAARVVAAADGRLVASGGWLQAVIARSDDPDFVARLYRAGASLVFRADGAVGCAGALPIENPQAPKIQGTS